MLRAGNVILSLVVYSGGPLPSIDSAGGLCRASFLRRNRKQFMLPEGDKSSEFSNFLSWSSLSDHRRYTRQRCKDQIDDDRVERCAANQQDERCPAWQIIAPWQSKKNSNKPREGSVIELGVHQGAHERKNVTSGTDHGHFRAEEHS